MDARDYLERPLRIFNRPSKSHGEITSIASQRDSLRYSVNTSVSERSRRSLTVFAIIAEREENSARIYKRREKGETENRSLDKFAAASNVAVSRFAILDLSQDGRATESREKIR